MDIQEAIRARHSVRSYMDKPLAAEAVEALEEEIAACNDESGLHIQLVTGEAEAFGGLDILVNDAGTVERDTLLEDMPEEVWFKVLNVNLKGTFLCTKYALPYLRESRGCVVSMSSTSGLVATKNDPAYCASKTGIIGLTRSIACDYGKYGVRANAVCPTICETPLFNAYIASFPPEEQSEKMKRLGGPGGRPCTREEIARTVLFLASDEAIYVSGAAVTVDGGYCIV